MSFKGLNKRQKANLDSDKLKGCEIKNGKKTKCTGNVLYPICNKEECYKFLMLIPVMAVLDIIAILAQIRGNLNLFTIK
mgnify:CR=1 FL=1